MDLTKMIPMDRNCAAELDLWTLQDFLGEAYSRVGGTPDPVAHRDIQLPLSPDAGGRIICLDQNPNPPAPSGLERECFRN